MSVYRRHGIELRLGDWREVLTGVEPSCILTDPPYTARTHRGHDSGGPQVMAITGQATRRALTYDAWTLETMHAAHLAWSAMATGWLAVMSSHDAIPTFERAAEESRRLAFAPVPVISKRPRLVGDGPASWAVYLLVSRPRTRRMATWGCLPGAYFTTPERHSSVVGAKPLELMRAIVRDYSRPGDLVCDPCAGGATTLIAAALEGRRAIGAEVDPDTYAAACARIERTAITPPLFAAGPEAQQEGWKW